jgi:hypothetical protein
MKKIILVLLILAATTTFAQHLYIEGGKSSTSFIGKKTNWKNFHFTDIL